MNLGMGLLLDAGPASLQNFQSFEIQVSVGPQALGPWPRSPDRYFAAPNRERIDRMSRRLIPTTI